MYVGTELDKGLRHNNAVPLAPGGGEEAAYPAISFKIIVSVYRPICACLLEFAFLLGLTLGPLGGLHNTVHHTVLIKL